MTELHQKGRGGREKAHRLGVRVRWGSEHRRAVATAATRGGAPMQAEEAVEHRVLRRVVGVDGGRRLPVWRGQRQVVPRVGLQRDVLHEVADRRLGWGDELEGAVHRAATTDAPPGHLHTRHHVPPELVLQVLQVDHTHGRALGERCDVLCHRARRLRRDRSLRHRLRRGAARPCASERPRMGALLVRGVRLWLSPRFPPCKRARAGP